MITKSGSNLFLYDASYYSQTAALTSQPVRLPILNTDRESSYQRARYRDFTTSLGGPVARDRLWFFSGYQHLRDYDSQPGTDPELPRKYEQDRIFAKLTWRLAPGWQLVQSFHDEFWSNPETPSPTKPLLATQRVEASVPALNLGHLMHTASHTVWDVRAGWFRFTQNTSPTSGDPTIPNRVDRPGELWSGGPQQIGGARHLRTMIKATLSHYRAGLFGADHEWRMGAQVGLGPAGAIRRRAASPHRLDRPLRETPRARPAAGRAPRDTAPRSASSVQASSRIRDAAILGGFRRVQVLAALSRFPDRREAQ